MTGVYAIDLAATQALDAEVRKAEKALQAIPGVGTGRMGLTPDSVKATEEYRQAKAAFDTAFKALRFANAAFLKLHKKQYARERALRVAKFTAAEVEAVHDTERRGEFSLLERDYTDATLAAALEAHPGPWSAKAAAILKVY